MKFCKGDKANYRDTMIIVLAADNRDKSYLIRPINSLADGNDFWVSKRDLKSYPTDNNRLLVSKLRDFAEELTGINREKLLQIIEEQ